MINTRKSYRDNLSKDMRSKRKDTQEEILKIEENSDILSGEKETSIQKTKDNLYQYLADARTTPEYDFSKNKHIEEKTLKKISKIADKYFSDDESFNENNISKYRNEAEDDIYYKDQYSHGGKKHKMNGMFVAPKEILIKKMKNLKNLNTEHIDLSLIKGDKANKHVLIDIVQLDPNDPRIVLSKRFLEKYPEYKNIVNIIGENRRMGDEERIDEEIGKININKEEQIKFLNEESERVNITEIPEPKKESFVIARPIISHGGHTIIARSFIEEKLVPEAGDKSNLGQYYGVKKNKNILEEINYKIINKIQDSYDAKKLVKLLIELAIRDKRWNQDPAPIVIVGGGFMTILEDDTIEISGVSGDFGEEERERTLEILKKELPDQKFITK